MQLSIISPVYRGEAMLDSLVSRIHHSVASQGLEYEIVLVNDASPDASWSRIEELCAQDSRIKGVNLSRNFGQHYAITAGLAFSTGEIVVVMDCDLQDRPEEIPRLLEQLDRGYDAVLAQRIARQDSFFKKFFSKAFYMTFSYLTDTKQDGSVANFGAYRRNVVDAILSMGDYTRYFPTMVQWVGFRRAYLPVEHASREQGKSSYSFTRLISLALDTILAFSNKPIRLITRLGFAIVALAIMLTLYFAAKYFIIGIPVSGFTALILSLWFSTGVIVTLLGSVGIYVGQIFDQTKSRPRFIVQQKLNFSSSQESENHSN